MWSVCWGWGEAEREPGVGVVGVSQKLPYYDHVYCGAYPMLRAPPEVTCICAIALLANALACLIAVVDRSLLDRLGRSTHLAARETPYA